MSNNKIFSLNVSNFKLDGGAMFGVVPKSIWQKYYPADENNLCTWSLRLLLVDTGERVILIDNGIGDKQDEKFFSFLHMSGGEGLVEGLKKRGYKPEDITDMVLTHLHFDHCGGGVCYNADRTAYELVFPNADYWVSREQWDWAMDPNNREKDSYLEENLLPMKESKKLKFVERDMQLVPGVELRLFYGHSEGQIIPFIKHNNSTIVYMGDLIPSSVHVPPHYVMAYDIKPLVAMKEKELFLEEALEGNYLLFFEHDLYNECCTLKETPKGIRLDKTYSLKEYFKE